jgi:Fic family protein
VNSRHIYRKFAANNFQPAANILDGKLNSSKWAKMAKCSTDTALRDMQDLVEKIFL